MRLFVDNLTNVDFSYLCPDRGLVGETWLANIELHGQLDEQGMVCDFGLVKKTLRKWLDEQIDHRLLVPAHHQALSLNEEGNEISVLFDTSVGRIQTLAPSSAITAIDASEITPTSVAQWCLKQLEGVFGDSVDQVQLNFSLEIIDGPQYQYSHGLKKHLGNCQRIAHGHRSRLQIWRNGQPDLGLTQEWAERWQDIYIATTEDCIAQTETHYQFAYTAQQGRFELQLPKPRCYFIETDSTVEYIAHHLASTIAAQNPGDTIQIKAFEGLGKGAIATA